MLYIAVYSNELDFRAIQHISMATFDTLKFAQRLEQAGIDPKQAAAFSEAQREVFSEAIETRLATKGDIQELKPELILIKRMLGIIILTQVLPFLQTFLPA